MENSTIYDLMVRIYCVVCTVCAAFYLCADFGTAITQQGGVFWFLITAVLAVFYNVYGSEVTPLILLSVSAISLIQLLGLFFWINLEQAAFLLWKRSFLVPRLIGGVIHLAILMVGVFLICHCVRWLLKNN